MADLTEAARAERSVVAETLTDFPADGALGRVCGRVAAFASPALVGLGAACCEAGEMEGEFVSCLPIVFSTAVEGEDATSAEAGTAERTRAAATAATSANARNRGGFGGWTGWNMPLIPP
ncbi:hypothetical protein [Actinospica robiniae]|uniref:hypothetical protein n=1 Tax=Actinospica robiniae TaxID=304901 RepID=UPI0012F9F3C8|nr:hypothetical protein [Actinospica robiniae]